MRNVTKFDTWPFSCYNYVDYKATLEVTTVLKLRTAINSQSDFEAFVRLHEAIDTSQLYIWDPPKEPISEEERKQAERYFEGFDWDSIRYKEDEFTYDTSEKNIVLVELDEIIIGAFQFFSINGKRYKFAEWCLDHEYQYLKEDIWDSFLKFFKINHKRTREFDVCLPSTKSVVRWFTEHGFVDKGSYFYTLYL